MVDSIDTAPTGRAKCRGCARPIAKGELRFGERLPNAYGEGDASFWFHLRCAACMRAEKFAVTLAQAEEALPERDQLAELSALAQRFAKLQRYAKAERSPSGRARCRACRELIEKDTWRISLQIFEEGRMSPIGHVHIACAAEYFGTPDFLQIATALESALSPSDWVELRRASEQPKLAKTQPEILDSDPEKSQAG